MNNGFYEFSRGKQEIATTSPVFPYTGSAVITGSLVVSGSITGSLFGTSSFAISSSRAVTSSFAISASWAPSQTVNTGSLVTTSSFNVFTSSYNTGSFTGSFSGVFTGSLFGTASRAISASYAVSGGNQNFQQVTNNGNTTTTSVIINSDNIGTAKLFRVNNTQYGNYTELYSEGLIITALSGTTSGYSNGALTLGDLNQDITNLVNLSVINDTTSYGVGLVLNSSAIIADASLIYHPNYFVSQSAYNAPVTFYIPYKPEATIVSLATLDDIPNTGSFVTNTTFNSFTSSYNTGSFTGSFTGDGSGLTNLPVQSVNTGSFATTGSNTFIGNQVITGSLNITGSITATTYDNLPTASVSSSGILSSTDWSTFNNRKKKVVSDTISATVSGTTTLTLVKTFEITAGTLPSSGFFDLYMLSTRSGLTGVHSMGLYINSTNNFATATLVNSIYTNGNFAAVLPYKGSFILKDNLIVGGSVNQSTGTNYVNTNSQTSVVCNNTSSSIWLFVGVTPTSTGQIINFQGIEITT